MSLIQCPECSKEISDKAISCPNCGMPINDVPKTIVSIDNDLNVPALKYPELPDDLSIGAGKIRHPDCFVKGYYESSGEGDFDTGELSMWLHEKGIAIHRTVYTSPLLKINYGQIISIDCVRGEEIVKNRSVLGRAAVGGLLLGPLGAVVGGMSGLKSYNAYPYMIILVYWDTYTKEPKTFSFLARDNSKLFIERLLKERYIYVSSNGIEDMMPASGSEKDLVAMLKNTQPDKDEAELLKTVRESKKNSSCFIATVVYEDNNCFQVQKLRIWRDMKLSKSYIGRMFIKIYYRVGEGLSLIIRPHQKIRGFIRIGLDYFVKKI